jgi:hypothetical protein
MSEACEGEGMKKHAVAIKVPRHVGIIPARAFWMGVFILAPNAMSWLPPKLSEKKKNGKRFRTYFTNYIFTALAFSAIIVNEFRILLDGRA